MSDAWIMEYKRQRLDNIKLWHDFVYCTLPKETHMAAKYVLLWAVFNAIYNVASSQFETITVDALRFRQGDDGFRLPRRHYVSERDALKSIACRMTLHAREEVEQIVAKHVETLKHFSQRKPQVRQPEGIDLESEILGTVNGHRYSVRLSDIRGIASLDRRVFLDDGRVLFEYSSLVLELDDNNRPVDFERLMSQLVLYLYQIRNNVVHGGSACSYEVEPELARKGLFILTDLVKLAFDNPNIILAPAVQQGEQ
jgi:hypothetical protein